MKRAGARRSKNAHAFSLAKFPEVIFQPEGGPVGKIEAPDGHEPAVPGKYRVVVTADCQIYGRWQVLVSLPVSQAEHPIDQSTTTYITLRGWIPPENACVQVAYYWYRRLKADFPDSAMGGYTRILHCPYSDDIMHLVPSIQVQQLPAGIDRGYGPMHRPWAFTQWLARMHVPEQYILMTEPDYIFISPPPLLATPTQPAAFPFPYVDCKLQKWRGQCEDVRFNENRIPVDSIYPVRAFAELSSPPTV